MPTPPVRWPLAPASSAGADMVPWVRSSRRPVRLAPAPRPDPPRHAILVQPNQAAALLAVSRRFSGWQLNKNSFRALLISSLPSPGRLRSARVPA